MKKLMMILLACTLRSLTAESQITKGNWMIGGDVGGALTVYKSDAGQHNTGYLFRIAPNIGYFMIDKLGAGLKSNITKQGTKATGTSVYTHYTDFNLGPFVRYYFLTADKTINIVAEGAYLYGFEGGSGKEQKISKNTFSLFAGPVVYFNSSASLEFLIGYSSSKFVNYKGRNGTLQLSLGLQVYLKKYD